MSKKKKKATRKSPAPRAAKANSKKKTTSKKPTRKKPSTADRASSSRGTSVDGILKKYQKDRTTQEVKLARIKAKIADLEIKTRTYRQQIEKLTEQEISMEQSISQLDSRRDAEVASLLAQLGVQIGTTPPPPAESTSPKVETTTSQEPPDQPASDDLEMSESD